MLSDPRALHERLVSRSSANLRYDFGEVAGGALEPLLARTELTALELTIVELAGSAIWDFESRRPTVWAVVPVGRSVGGPR